MIDTPQGIKHQEWDAVIVGTGMGGGTAGYALAKAGYRVLFIEKGIDPRLNKDQTIYGFPEDHFPNIRGAQPSDQPLLAQAGRTTDSIIDVISGKHRSFTPLVGGGLGGSSSIYGAAMERFFPEDFTVSKYFKDAEGSSAVDWPFEYNELTPFYEKAEQLYEVSGSPDPLRNNYQSSSLPVPSLSPAGNELFNHFQQRGLHPYRLPTAHSHADECPGCQGTLCPNRTKWGSTEKCVLPAISSLGAKLLTDAEVISIEANNNTVQSLKVRYQGNTINIKASKFILGAGALQTAKLLLSSKSNFWPHGLGNHNDMVGRNFMRHYMDLHMVVNNFSRRYKDVPQKELALNDFYIYQGKKYGTIQSLGNYPSIKASLCEMHAEIKARHPRLSHLLFPIEASYSTLGMKFLYPRTTGFATVMEDTPYANNRISVTDEVNPRIVINYELSDFEKERIRTFRKLVSSSFKPYISLMHKQAENNQRLAHACGTCRMGSKPESSVVDIWGKVHGIDNLYIADASVFPTGSGINPALTIAALALRTAENIARQKL